MKKRNKYGIIKLIHEGMIARCYKARDSILNRSVLLKILRPQLISDTQCRKRFEREAVIQAKLRHPNIVTIYELGKGDDFYIASEYIHGMTLKEMIEKKGPLDLNLLSPIIQQIVAALRYAHKKGVVHRDLKPGNILISQKNKVKLADFGLAFTYDGDSITQEGYVLGTPAYMSPEQARGRKIDNRSDIFSLGVTIYEALSGKNPFKGDSLADSINRILNFDPKPLTEVLPDIPANVSDIISKMLIKDRDKRLSKLDELESVLAQHTGLVVSKQKYRKFRLRYALFSIPFIILVIFVLSLLIERKNDRAILISERDSMPSLSEIIDTVYLVSEKPPAPKRKPVVPSTIPSNESITVRILVDPWAVVYIDGDSIGVTPLREDIRIEQGVHLVTLRHPYFPVFKDTIEILEAGRLHYNLYEEFAFFDIKVKPWGIIYIDGVPVDTTPIKKPIPVHLGEHMIVIRHPELGEEMTRVVADSAGKYQLTFNLQVK